MRSFSQFYLKKQKNFVYRVAAVIFGARNQPLEYFLLHSIAYHFQSATDFFPFHHPLVGSRHYYQRDGHDHDPVVR